MKNLITPVFVLALLFNCQSKSTITSSDSSESIRINQLGYFVNGPKKFVVADIAARTFQIVDATGKSVFEGDLEDKGTWDKSGGCFAW